MANDKPKDSEMTANEFGQLRAYLARQGVSQAAIKEWIGTSAQGRTRGEIADQLKENLKTLPAASE